jgi:hypothetical protein
VIGFKVLGVLGRACSADSMDDHAGNIGFKLSVSSSSLILFFNIIVCNSCLEMEW